MVKAEQIQNKIDRLEDLIQEEEVRELSDYKAKQLGDIDQSTLDSRLRSRAKDINRWKSEIKELQAQLNSDLISNEYTVRSEFTIPETKSVYQSKSTQQRYLFLLVFTIAIIIMVLLNFGVNKQSQDVKPVTDTGVPFKATFMNVLPTSTHNPLDPTYTQTSSYDYRQGNDAWKRFITEHKFDDGVTMVLVPAGQFRMGRDSDNTDAKPFSFNKPFWIDKTEVTQQDFVRLGGVMASSMISRDDKKPLVNITPKQARDFCRLRFADLPTELQWEYAASGPSDWLYPWGDKFEPDLVTYGNNSNSSNEVAFHELGRSWIGAVDMSGNVAEWTVMSTSSENYGSRGGSFKDLRQALSTISKDQNLKGANEETGFRCVRNFVE